jgi:hypothetical protein
VNLVFTGQHHDDARFRVFRPFGVQMDFIQRKISQGENIYLANIYPEQPILCSVNQSGQLNRVGADRKTPVTAYRNGRSTGLFNPIILAPI